MKLKITITGPKVHDVGYKPFLILLAGEFELDGIGVRDKEVGGEQAVRIKAEGDDEDVQEFDEAVRTQRPEGAIVSNVKSEPYDGRVPSIVRATIVNMNTQLAKGIKRLDESPVHKDL
ncbi:MAG: acylphosphatase [Methanotrichaceae archaeon]